MRKQTPPRLSDGDSDRQIQVTVTVHGMQPNFSLPTVREWAWQGSRQSRLKERFVRSLRANDGRGAAGCGAQAVLDDRALSSCGLLCKLSGYVCLQRRIRIHWDVGRDERKTGWLMIGWTAEVGTSRRPSAGAAATWNDG